MSQEPVRYGVVGLGRAGWNIHVAGLRNRPDAKIVAVVDPVEERRQQAHTELGAKGYTELSQLLADPDVEVVVVATPSVSHGPDTIAALKAGKHVVVEKPMAMNVEEADRMIQTARETGKKLFVHQNYRFFADYNFMKETIESGILGRVFHFRNYINAFSRRNDWQTLAKNGGGVLNNTCPHFIDQILQFLGAPVKLVVGDLQQIVSAGDVEDHVKAFFRAENGVTADMEISNAQNVAVKLPKWIIAGSAGTLTTDGKTATINYYDASKVQPLQVVEGPAADRKYGNEDKLPWETRTVEISEAVKDKTNFYDNVYGVLRKGEAMRVTPESVREVIRVIAAIREGTPFTGEPRIK